VADNTLCSLEIIFHRPLTDVLSSGTRLNPSRMSDIEYHLKELEIQKRTDDRRHVRPPIPEHTRRVLDIGCGIGQTLVTTTLPPGTKAFGIDLDEEALIFGARMERSIQFARASGEQLPFADRSFDMVIARVSLPWMHMPSALREVFRVLDHGGCIWISLVDLSAALSHLVTAIRGRNLKNVVYRLYVLINGAAFHLTGKQFRFPFRRQRCESFQTSEGVRRFLSRIGFERIQVGREQLFIVTARKP
jgi:ubiquinone/menaquinone biosynthesis C-methylase UbiE